MSKQYVFIIPLMYKSIDVHQALKNSDQYLLFDFGALFQHELEDKIEILHNIIIKTYIIKRQSKKEYI